MEDGKQLSTTSNPPGPLSKGERGTMGLRDTRPECLQKSPVAVRMLERCNGTDRTDGTDEITLAAVVVVAATDRSITTAAESVRSTGQVSVKRFAKDFDERTLAALILTHLTIVEDMVNVARPMKPEAMAILAKSIAKLLTDDDMTINLADIQIVADRLANGDAGQVYGGLNAPMVTKAFTDYMAEKANAFADMREREAREQYGSFGERGGDPYAMEKEKFRKAMHDYQLGKMREETKGEG